MYFVVVGRLKSYFAIMLYLIALNLMWPFDSYKHKT